MPYVRASLSGLPGGSCQAEGNRFDGWGSDAEEAAGNGLVESRLTSRDQDLATLAV